MGVLIGRNNSNDYVFRLTAAGTDALTAPASATVFDSDSIPMRFLLAGSVAVLPNAAGTAFREVTVAIPTQTVTPMVFLSLSTPGTTQLTFPGDVVNGGMQSLPAGSIRKVAYPGVGLQSGPFIMDRTLACDVSRTELVIRTSYTRTGSGNFTVNYTLFLPI